MPAYVRSEKGDDFAGPSRPRLVYERPGEKDLPKLKVSSVDVCLGGSEADKAESRTAM